MARILQYLLGSVFTLAGVGHYLNAHAFVVSMAAYDLVPINLLPLAAFIVIAMKICIGLSLLTGKCKKVASLAAVILLASFFIAVSAALYRNLPIACGTIPGVSEQISFFTLVRIIGLFGIALIQFLESQNTGASSDESVLLS